MAKLPSETFCVIPFLNLSMTTGGLARPCGWLISDRGHLPNIYEEGLDKVWNSETFCNIRKAALNGTQSKFCWKCFEFEKLGGASLRLQELENYSESEVSSLIAGVTVEGRMNSAPRNFDLRIGNTCNLRCLICNSVNSSAWQEEQVRFGQLSKNSGTYNHSPAALNQFCEDIISRIDEDPTQIQKLQFSGGEPLLTDHHKRILRQLDAHKRHDVAISYSTNLSVMSQELIDLWNKFDNIQIQISVDGISERFETLRYPAKWKNLVHNVEMLEARVDLNHVKLLFDFTASNLSILTLPETQQELMRMFPDVPLLIGSHVAHPSFMSLQNLPKELKTIVSKQLSQMDLGADQFKVEELIKVMNAADLWPEHGEKLYEFLEEMDRRRGQDWRSVFPEIASLFQESRKLATVIPTVHG